MFSHVSVHPSVCPHLTGYPSQVQMRVPQPGPVGGTLAGGTPLRIPLSDLAGGYPGGGTLLRGTLLGGTLPWVPPSDLARGTPAGGYLTSGTPVRPGCGVPGRVPTIRPGWGGTLAGVPWWGYPASGTPIRPGQGVPLPGGYPTSGNRWSARYTAVGMPLAFTQEDFLVCFGFILICVILVYCKSRLG